MCLIIYKKRTDRLEEFDLRQYESANPHGWGIMYIERGKPVVLRGMDAHSLIEAWEPLELGGASFFIHLRQATHGDRNVENTHPFEVVDGLWMMHNGIINDVSCASDNTKSDSWHFADKVLRPIFEPMSPDERIAFMRSEACNWIISQTRDRIVLMDRDGALMFNTKMWHTLPSGLFVSNSYALGPRKIENTKYGVYNHATGKFEYQKETPLLPVARVRTDEEIEALLADYYAEEQEKLEAEKTEKESPFGDLDDINDSAEEIIEKSGLAAATPEELTDFVYQQPEHAAKVMRSMFGWEYTEDCLA